MRIVGPSVILIALVLAGCASPPPGSQGDPLRATGAQGPLVIPAVPDGTGQGAYRAAPGMALDVDEAATEWMRAYWADRTEVELHNGTVSVSNFRGFLFDCFGCAERVTFEEGLLVPLGTEAVEVAANYTPDLGPLRLSYYTGGRHNITTLEPGQTLRIPVALEDTDAPFEEHSAWALFLWFEGEGDGFGSDSRDVDLRVVEHRMAELPLVLAPNPWRGRDVITLVEGQGRQNTGLNFFGFYSLCTYCEGTFWIPVGAAVVPEGSEVIRAELAWDYPTGSVSKVRLLGYAYDREQGFYERTDPVLVEDAEGRRAYEFPLGDDHVDSPYARRSRWVFQGVPDTAGFPLGVMAGTMTLSAEVVKAGAAPPEAP